MTTQTTSGEQNLPKADKVIVKKSTVTNQILPKTQEPSVIKMPMEICGTCQHHIRLRVFMLDHNAHFVGMGCECGAKTRESTYYSTHSLANTALVSGSWRS